MGWATAHHPTEEGLDACVQCGLCLPMCPTFRLTGRETASPRGRLQAMSAVADGLAEVDAKFEEIIDFCLGCRACEPVCPGMVPYGSLLEGARAEIVAQRPSLGRRFRGLILGRLIAASSFRAAATVLARLARKRVMRRAIPQRFRRSIEGMREESGASRVGPIGPSGAETIGLLVGCVQDSWFPEVNSAAASLLARAGYRVEVPERQTCCGALAAHDGHADAAERFNARNGAAFSGYDRIVATAAGCSAHMNDVMDNATDALTLVSEAVGEGRLPRLPPSGEKVVVQDPCHHNHAQGINDETRRVLEAAGYVAVSLDDDGMCCGAAGLYTMLQPVASQQLGRQKADLIEATGVTLVASGNPGCEMQLRAMLGDSHHIAHPLELYLEALEAEPAGAAL